LTRSVVSLAFSDGSQFDAFTSWSLRETFSDPIGSMEFTVEPPAAKVSEYRANLQKGKLVGCKVDGKPQAAMMIQTTRWSVDHEGGTRGYVQSVTPLKQLYEASVDPRVSKSLAADAPVIDLVNEVTAPFGIGAATADNDIGAIRSKTGKSPTATATPVEPLKYTEAKAQDNETAYAFLARILTRLGVMMRMNPVTGQIDITAPHYTGDPIYTVVQARPGSSVVGDAFFNIQEIDTNEGQFSACTVRGAPIDQSGSTRAQKPLGLTATGEICSPPPYRSGDGLNYKPKLVRDASCRDAARAKRVSKMVLGLAAEKAYAVSGTVNGLVSRDGIPWAVDTLGRVYVDAIGIDSVMWLSERTMSYSTDDGQRTDLVWIPKGAFTLGDVG
jgi:prophage tail gpP-like protein